MRIAEVAVNDIKAGTESSGLISNICAREGGRRDAMATEGKWVCISLSLIAEKGCWALILEKMSVALTGRVKYFEADENNRFKDS